MKHSWACPPPSYNHPASKKPPKTAGCQSQVPCFTCQSRPPTRRRLAPFM